MKKRLRIVPYSQWKWRDDKKWVKYDEKMNLKLEYSYQIGKKKVKTDSERYVDLALTNDELIDHFDSVPCPPNQYIAIQRRQDDIWRRRPVKRKCLDVFKGLVCAISGDTTNGDYAYIKSVMESCGATVRNQASKSVDVFIVDEDITATNDKIKKAQSLGIDIVTDAWVIDSLKNKIKVDDNSKYLHGSFSNKATPTVSDKMDISESSEDKKPKKVEKKATTTNMSTSSSQEKVEIKIETKNPLKRDRDETDTTDDNPVVKKRRIITCPTPVMDLTIRKNMQWMGICIYPGLGTFPFIMNILSVTANNNIEGTIQWPSLNNAKSKIKGSVNGGKFNYEEYEVIQGEEEIEIPSFYEVAATSATQADGVVLPKDPEDLEMQGTVQLNLVLQGDDPEEENDIFKLDYNYNGKCFTQFSFQMIIKSRKGKEFEGELLWEAYDASTKIIGQIEDNELIFEEYELSKIDEDIPNIILPMFYKGRLDIKAESLTGVFGTDLKYDRGTFKIPFDQNIVLPVKIEK